METSQQSTSGTAPAFDIEEIFRDAEGRLHESLESFNRVTSQLRDTFKSRPALGMGAVMAVGFFAGLLFRRGKLNMNTLRSSMSVEPVVLLAAGAVAGYTVGPRLMEELEGTGLQTTTPASPLAELGRH